jgi:hypothetical protein
MDILDRSLGESHPDLVLTPDGRTTLRSILIPLWQQLSTTPNLQQYVSTWPGQLGTTALRGLRKFQTEQSPMNKFGTVDPRVYTLQFVIGEILEEAGNRARDNGRQSVESYDVNQTIVNDPELSRLLRVS